MEQQSYFSLTDIEIGAPNLGGHAPYPWNPILGIFGQHGRDDLHFSRGESAKGIQRGTATSIQGRFGLIHIYLPFL